MTLGEISQSLSALFFLNDSLQNRSVALAQRVAGHARELDVGIFELHAQAVLGNMNTIAKTRRLRFKLTQYPYVAGYNDCSRTLAEAIRQVNWSWEEYQQWIQTHSSHSAPAPATDDKASETDKS